MTTNQELRKLLEKEASVCGLLIEQLEMGKVRFKSYLGSNNPYQKSVVELPENVKDQIKFLYEHRDAFLTAEVRGIINKNYQDLVKSQN